MSFYDRNEIDLRYEGEESAEIQSNRGALIKNTYALLTASMIAASAGAYVGMMMNMHVNVILFLVGIFGLSFAMNAAVAKRAEGLALGLLFAFTFFTGFSLGYILNAYIAAGMGKAITNAFVTTAVAFGALTCYAMNTKRDFSRWYKPMFWAFWGIFAMALLNYFVFQSGILALGISVLIGLISSFFVVIETKMIINGVYTSPILAACSLYVSIFNMFQSLLHIFGVMGEE